MVVANPWLFKKSSHPSCRRPLTEARFITRTGTGASMEWLPPDWCPSVVVIDIDGTITDGKKHLSTEAVLAIRKLEDAGVPVVLATGNVRPVTYGLWRFLGLSAPMCCENGGVIWHPSWEEPMLRSACDRALLAPCLHTCRPALS